MKKSLLAVFMLAIFVMPQPSFADSNPTTYDVSDQASINSALSDTTSVDKVVYFNSNINVNQNLSTVQGTSVLIDGNSQEMSFGANSTGFNISPSLTSLTLRNLKISNMDAGFLSTADDTATQNAAAIYNPGTSNINLSNVEFIGNKNRLDTSELNGVINGGNIYNNSGSVNISGNTFDSNYTELVLSNPNQNEADIYGGNIYNNSGLLNIENSIFKNNTVSVQSKGFPSCPIESVSGGAIYNYDSGIVNISNSTFINNSIKIQISDSNSNTILSEGVSGGILCNNLGSATIANSTFKNNSIDFQYEVKAHQQISECANGLISNQRGPEGGRSGCIDISDSRFLNNSIRELSEANYDPDPASSVEFYGAVISNGPCNSSINVANSIFDSNSISKPNLLDSLDVGQFEAYGVAIYNQSFMNVSNSVFTNNKINISATNASAFGGAIYNTGYMTITNSVFNNNSVSSNGFSDGGAIFNCQDMTITNSVFKGNSTDGVSAQGGAIYSGGNLNIVSDNGITDFENNTANASNNDIYVDGGTLNLYSGNSGYIIFNSGIDGSNYSLNINTSNHAPDTVYANSGNVIFNCTVSNAAITLNNGILTLGKYDPSNYSASYFDNSSLTLNGGILNAVNGVTNSHLTLTSLKSSSNAGLFFDLLLADHVFPSSDKFDITSGITTGSSLTIEGINIIADYAIGSGNFTLFTSENSDIAHLTLDPTKLHAYSNNYKYSFAGTSTDGTITFAQSADGGLANAVHDSIKYKSYSSYGPTTANADLGTMGGSQLTIFGRQKSFDGNGHVGLTVNANQTVNIFDAGAATLSDVTSGEYMSYSNITDSVSNFKDAFLSLLGGTANIYNSVFTNNASSNMAGCILNRSTTNITNSLFFNNTTGIGGSSFGLGGAILNSGTLNVFGSVFDKNGMAVNDSSNESDGGAISNKQSGSILNIEKSTFLNNYITGTASQAYGGAISNEGTAKISNSAFFSNHIILNSGEADGGAIWNQNSLSVSNSTFANNFANSITGSAYGGAIYNHSSGNVTLTNVSFDSNSATTDGGAIYNAGLLNIIADGADSTFTNNYVGVNPNATPNDIYNSGTLNLNTSAGRSITFNDGIKGNGTININGTHTDNPTINTTVNSGTVAFNAPVSASAIKLYNGTLALGADNNIDHNALSISGGTLNLQNNAVGTMNLASLNLTNSSNLKIDVDLANSKADKINAASVSGTGTLNINAIKIYNESKPAGPIAITDSSALYNKFTMSVNKAYSPIYQYGVSYDNNGNLLFTGGPSASGGGTSSDFNPAVLSSPVAANVGSYMSQVNIYTEVLSRPDTFMSLPSSERMLMRYNNMYANVGGNDAQPEVFSPTYQPDVRGGLWLKQYTTFENVPLNNGPNVSNVGYGAIVGGDTPMYSLKHGWDGVTTVYAAYNGSHQNYDQVGVYQNGGALGITESLYKGNFFTALTASAGDSYGQANTMYGVDNFNTLLAGLAWKSGYNIEFKEGKFILQPSFLASYTFAKTFDYTTASGVNVSSDPLNALQIAPGLKFIYNAKNGWQPYLAIHMVWNIMDAQKFRANDAQLPQMSIDPYFEYGLGVQRRWGERFTGFGQFMLRGGGRNGIALMFGFRRALGK